MQTTAGCPETAVAILRAIWATCGRIEALAREGAPQAGREITRAAGTLRELRPALAAIEVGTELLAAARAAGREECEREIMERLAAEGACRPPLQLAVVG